MRKSKSSKCTWGRIRLSFPFATFWDKKVCFERSFRHLDFKCLWNDTISDSPASSRSAGWRTEGEKNYDDDDSDDNGDKEDHFISSMQVSELEGILKRQGEEGYRTSIQEEVRNWCICIWCECICICLCICICTSIWGGGAQNVQEEVEIMYLH